MSDQITSAPVQPAFEDMSHHARLHHLRTAHGRRNRRTASARVHSILHDLAPYELRYVELDLIARHAAIALTEDGTAASWDAEVHTHREPV